MTSRPADAQSRSAFWEGVHNGKSQDAVSWWQPVPQLSLDLIEGTGLDPSLPIVDVGGGWSTLVDHLVDRGYGDLTVLDLSDTALRAVRDRLGDAGAGVRLEVADVLDLTPGRQYSLWHDRAVFHFLTDAPERDAYRASLLSSVAPDGWVVISTFGPDGPLMCSGLPIVRYSGAQLAAQFGADFDVVATTSEDHVTPWDSTQQFTAMLLRRRSA